MSLEIGRRAGRFWLREQWHGDEDSAELACEEIAANGVEAAVFRDGAIVDYIDPAAFAVAKPERLARRRRRA